MRLYRSNMPAFVGGLFAFCCAWLLALPVNAQEDAAAGQGTSVDAAIEQTRSPVDEEGNVVNFQRDIAPIFATRCLECHRGDEAKAGFDISDRDTVLGYIEPEDASSSTLYADFITTSDPDMLMPPTSHGGPLSPAEIALVRIWIEEGAAWPDDAVVDEDAVKDDSEVEFAVPDSESTLGRFWAFQGYFHPATVHFPIALLTIGGLFVVLGLKWPKLGTQVPFACLLIGSVSAVVASAMGWGFAVERGYAGYQMGFEREIDAHRWSGTIVASISVVLALIAIVSVNRESKFLSFLWKGGLLFLALTVGLVGHQGGELTYGKEFYAKAFERLWGKTTDVVENVEETVTDALDG